MSENGEIYTTGKNFTLPPALTGWTNFTSGPEVPPLLGLRTLIVVSIKKRDLERFHCLEKYRVLILQCLHICKFKRKF